MKLKELIEELAKISHYKQLSFHFGTIINVDQFLSTHISYLKANTGNKRFIPYYKRLLEFYQANK
jgi:hypothetical protein